MPPRVPKRMSKKHADGCICEKCCPKSKKPSVHLRFITEPEELPVCANCRNSPPAFEGAELCKGCYGRTVRNLEAEAARALYRAKAQSAEEYRTTWNEQMNNFHSMFSEFPFEPVALSYATRKYYHLEHLSKKEFKTEAKRERNNMIRNFTDILKIQRGADKKWICCKNRFDSSDLRAYLRIRNRAPPREYPHLINKKKNQNTNQTEEVQLPIPQDEHHEPLNIKLEKKKTQDKGVAGPSDAVSNNDSNSNKQLSEEDYQNNENEAPMDVVDEEEDVGGPEGENSLHAAGNNQVNTLADADAPPPFETSNEHEECVEVEGNSVPDAGLDLNASSDSELETIPVTRQQKTPPCVFLNSSDSEAERKPSLDKLEVRKKKIKARNQKRAKSPSPSPPPRSKAHKRSRKKSPGLSPPPVKKTASKKQTVPVPANLVLDKDESEGDSDSSATSSTSKSYDSNASSVINSSDADRLEAPDPDIQIEVASDEEPASAPKNRRIQPMVVIETLEELSTKAKEKRETMNSWKKLEREREDFEEEALGHIPFLKCPLKHAVEVLTRKFGWHVFPFGARTLNRGKLTSKQMENPNTGSWLELKEQFIKRHFKTALSITPCKGKWYCCKNRLDALDHKAYLRDYWNIEIK